MGSLSLTYLSEETTFINMTEISIIILLILLNGAFSMSEMAVVNTRKSSLATDARKGNRAARTAMKMKENTDNFLSTVQIGITLIGILTGIFSGASLSGEFARVLIDAGLTPHIADEIAQIIIVIIVTYLTLIFGELLPKRIGLYAPEKMSLIIARPMYFLSKIATPFVWILSKSTVALFRLFGLKEKDGKVTEEEIKSIVREGREYGEVQEVEQNIVERVFVLGDMKVGTLMTHRTEMVTLDAGMSLRQVRDVLSEHIHQVYPVVRKSIDDLVGMVSLKDLVKAFDSREEDFSLPALCRPMQAFHENMSVYNALERMKENDASVALVYDEFGMCQGIITLKDILEGLVGRFAGPGDSEIVERADHKSWLVDGQCPMYDFLSRFNATEYYEDYPFNTVSGLILDLTGDIPQTGQTVSWKDFVFEIVDMDGARIDKIMVRRQPSSDKK